ncbi:hypothetical protein FOCG_11909 [Fusarium oxysporum f. sp. radicis-lycopersici 26381]|uniref:Uncharacterized protein n=1 Tax=Fusarium oxysporum Fo47 TaxID=660027 RepID=W9KXC8_FUSOX|nr:hypothetical protein FOZG_00080 [Fusarium oxysporum Fo47]EXL45913.1 hypothetical protein FOCG_11909 [Fusarium oxysporum f. sp. radicis-lycopersici 26381]
MSPGESSRKGKPIARRACDLCRSRKLQCVFDQLGTSCKRCVQVEMPCTFMTTRKPRGPPNRAVELPKLKPRVTILTTRIQRMKE